jgi:hypothetical protein
MTSDKLIEAVNRLLVEIDQMECGCSLAERYSGHLVECRMPSVQIAADEVYQIITEEKPDSTPEANSPAK